MSYTVSEAKNKAPELIRQAEAGVRVTITKRGVPVVELVRRTEGPPRKRAFGVLGSKPVVVDHNWARTQNDGNCLLSHLAASRQPFFLICLCTTQGSLRSHDHRYGIKRRYPGRLL